MKASLSFRRAALVVIAITLLHSVCSGQQTTRVPEPETDEYATPPVSDPLEKANRAIFRFNDGLYSHVVHPIARAYERVVPARVRRGLTNFFDNLAFPLRFVSCALQAKPVRAGRELEKFVLNSTIGVGGIIRVSNSFPKLAAVPAEDLGQTFGTWGVGPGVYLVLPFFGPSTLRDTVGLVGASYLNPVTWSGTHHTIRGYNYHWQYGIEGLELVNSSPGLIRTYESFKQSAIDPYSSVRNGYLQYRAAAVKQ